MAPGMKVWICALAVGSGLVTPPRDGGVHDEDLSLAIFVKGKLADLVPDSANVVVEACDGVVTLSGAVSSPPVRQRVTGIVQHIKGVRRVQDQLRLTTQPGAFKVSGPTAVACSNPAGSDSASGLGCGSRARARRH